MTDKWSRFLRDAMGDVVRPVAPAPMPKYESGGNLRVREGAPGQQNRAYAAPPVLPPVTPEQAMYRAGLVQQAVDNYRASQLLPTPTPHSPAMDTDAFLNQVQAGLPPAPVIPPTGPSPYVMPTPPEPAGNLRTFSPDGNNGVGSQSYIDYITKWYNLPPDVRAVTAPVDPQGVPFPNWQGLGEDQQSLVADRLLDGARGSDDPLAAGAHVVGDARDDVVNTVSDSVIGDILRFDPTKHLDSIPVVGGVLDSIANAGPKLDDAKDWWTAITAPIGIVDRMIDAGQNVIENTDLQDIKDAPRDLYEGGKNYVGNVKDAGGQFIDDPSLDTALNLGGQLLKPAFDAVDAPLSQVKEATGERMYDAALGRGTPESGQPDPMLQWVADHPEEWDTIKDVYVHGYDFNQDGHTDFTGSRAVWEYVIGKQDALTRTIADVAYDPLTAVTPAIGRAGTGIREAEGAGLARRAVGRGLEATNLPNTVFDEVVGNALKPVGKAVSKAREGVGHVPGVTRLSDYLSGPDSRTAYRQAREEVENLTDAGVSGIDEVVNNPTEDFVLRESDRVQGVYQDAADRTARTMRDKGYVMPGDSESVTFKTDSNGRLIQDITPEQEARARYNVEQAVRPTRNEPKKPGWSMAPNEGRYTEALARGETPNQVDVLRYEHGEEFWNEISSDPAVKRAVEQYEPRYTSGGGKRSKMDATYAEMAQQATIRNAALSRGVADLPPVRLPSDAYVPRNDRAMATRFAQYLAGEDIPNADVTRLMNDPYVERHLESVQRIRERFRSEGSISDGIAERRGAEGLGKVYGASSQSAAKDALPYRERAVKNPYIRAAMGAADQLPPDAEQRVADGVRDWADTAYTNYDGQTVFEKTITDLEYGGRLRASVYAEGGELPDFVSQPAEVYEPRNFDKPNGDFDSDSAFVAVVMEPDFEKTKRLRTEMYQSGYLNQNPPRLRPEEGRITKSQYASTDIPAYVAHQQAYERYLSMYHLRHQLHADPEDVLKGVDWMPGMEAVPDEQFTAPFKPIKGPRPDKITEQVYFVEDKAGQRVRREDGQLWWAHQKQDATAYAKRLTDGEEAAPAQFRRKATPDVDTADPAAETPMRTFANEVEHNARLDAEIADSQLPIDQMPEPTPNGRPSQVERAKQSTRGPKANGRVNGKVPGFAPPSEYQRIFRANFERAMKESGPLTPDADVFLSEMAEHGILTPEIEQGLKQVIGEGENQTTVIDVILKHYNDSFDEATMTVDRALAKRKAQAEIAKLKGIALPKSRNLIDSMWNGLDDLTALAKSALIANPFTGPILGGRDMAGNAYSMGVLNGRWDVVNKARDPKAIKGFMLHNLNGGELDVPGLDVVNGWGVKPGRNVVDIQVKDIGGDISDRTIWERFLGGDRGMQEGERSWKRFTTMGKYGRVMSNAVVAKPVLAWRHTGDQVFRWSYFSTLVDEGMTAERHAFYDSIRQAMPNDADRVIAQLDDMRTFTRKDVFDLTKNKELSKDWLQRTNKVKNFADSEVNRVYFSYDQTRLDAALRRTVMFHYWLSRHSIFHAKAVLSNPALIYRYHQAWDAMDRWAEENGASNPLKYYVSYQSQSGWFESIMNPVGILVPYTMFADLGGERRDGESNLDYINRTMGVFIAPHVQAAALILGKSKQYPDMLGLGSVFGNLTNLHNWARNQGIDIPGLREGVTPNVVKSVNDRLLNLANEAAQWVSGGEIEDVALPDQVEQQKGVVMDILLDQALTEYDVQSYWDLPTKVQKEVDAAMLAVETGTSGNERAANAYKAWGDMRGGYQLQRMANPIPSYTRSTGRTERTQATSEGFDALDAGSEPTAEQRAAMANSSYLGATPEARELEGQAQEYREMGDPVGKGYAQARDEILYGGEGEIPDDYTMTVKGKTFTFGQIRAMTDDQRRYVADQWLAEQGPDAAKAVEQYDTDRKAFREANPELDGYLDWRKQAGKVGEREFRTQVAAMNPNFRRALDARRKRLEADGLTGEELDAELDKWAVSTDGYFAFYGKEANRTDPNPIAVNDPTAVPVMPQAKGAESSGGSSGGSSSGWNEELGMPQYQVDDTAEITAYYADVDKILQAAGVSDINALNPTAQDFVLKDLPEKPRSVSSYESWVKKQPKGADTSLDAYWASKNEEYDKKKNREVETSLGI